jgi:D-xylose 1-dehydrogenase (NADP+, D-xylono-1,4-lactone-forming)
MGLESYFENFAHRDWQKIDPDGTVRIGGFSRNRALSAIDSGDYCETTVLVTGSSDSSAKIADKFDVDTLLSYEEFLDGQATDAYDAIYIATPNAIHGRYATAAAQFGKHVICENGDVVQIHAGFSDPLLEHTGTDTWRLGPDLAGGDALVDLGCIR